MQRQCSGSSRQPTPQLYAWGSSLDLPYAYHTAELFSCFLSIVLSRWREAFDDGALYQKIRAMFDPAGDSVAVTGFAKCCHTVDDDFDLAADHVTDLLVRMRMGWDFHPGLRAELGKHHIAGFPQRSTGQSRQRINGPSFFPTNNISHDFTPLKQLSVLDDCLAAYHAQRFAISWSMTADR